MSDKSASAATEIELLTEARRLCAEIGRTWPGTMSEKLTLSLLMDCLNELAERPGVHPLIALHASPGLRIIDGGRQ
jgi:hypothetical protein